jgi:hypothetical protein
VECGELARFFMVGPTVKRRPNNCGTSPTVRRSVGMTQRVAIVARLTTAQGGSPEVDVTSESRSGAESGYLT